MKMDNRNTLEKSGEHKIIPKNNERRINFMEIELKLRRMLL